ncbi:hypothetical protein ACWATV_001675 [Morganella morganii]
MGNDKKLVVLLAMQKSLSEKLAAHATRNKPTEFQQSLQDKLFAQFDRVTARISAYLNK